MRNGIANSIYLAAIIVAGCTTTPVGKLDESQLPIAMRPMFGSPANSRPFSGRVVVVGSDILPFGKPHPHSRAKKPLDVFKNAKAHRFIASVG